MSPAVVHGDTVLLSGLVGSDLTADVKGQTAQILDRVDQLLAAAGSDKTKVLRANIWLADIREWSRMNEIWDEWVDPTATPTRAAVEAKMADPRIRVEIMIDAVR